MRVCARMIFKSLLPIAANKDDEQIIEYSDAKKGVHRVARLEGDRITGALFVGPERPALGRDWVSKLFGADAIAPMAEEVTTLLTSGGLITELPFDGAIEIKPYSLITARGHRLSPSAQLVSDHILSRIEKPHG